MKTKTKKKRLSIMTIFILAFMMIGTTAITFAFWAAGIGGADGDRGTDIDIGTGRQVTTELTFADSVTPGNLIPQTIAPRTEFNEVNEIVFAVTVRWMAESGTDRPQDLDGVIGELDVSTVSIVIEGRDFANETGRDGLGLFVIDIDNPGEIIGNDTDGVVVTITVRMNEPRDRDQYILVSGGTARLIFNFAVEPAENAV